MKILLGFFVLMGSVMVAAPCSYGEEKMAHTSPTIDSITAVLPVDSVGPSAAFFEAIGFTRDSEVPMADGSLGFVIMKSGNTQIMYQSKASIREDSDVLAEGADVAPVLIYITVSDVKAVEAALNKGGYNQIMALRETFYGATEVSFREPGGHIITFAQFGG